SVTPPASTVCRPAPTRAETCANSAASSLISSAPAARCRSATCQPKPETRATRVVIVSRTAAIQPESAAVSGTYRFLQLGELRNKPGIISRSFRNHGPSCGKVSSPCHRADRRTGLQPGPRRETCGPADGGAERLDGATHFVAASACKGSTLTGTERASGSD